ncbi:ECF transporter S component [Helcococcus kunzii]|uniref:ECF transporter S component n=1 Tax=Helcococcus kunzii TaxID=40091 RepID=UPI0021A4D528|nr:ECF transporter S component [Helcococcus kunzii]MCT1795814.1 ECF transporter S component [Helcococcus kunzii]MCT1989393.1 ECF transporter S component [Helcococcus kunzii]
MEMTGNKKVVRVFSIGNMAKIAIFSALAGVLMLFKFPIPIAPAFMTVDFGDVATLVSGFVLGPISGIIIVIMKNLINIVLDGTMTAYVGELSNIIVGSIFVGVSSYIYSKNKTRKSAIIGLIGGIVAMTILATLSNYFVIFPIYAKVMHIDLEGFVNFAPKFVKSYNQLIVLSVIPFNLVKGTLNAIVTLIVYKKISRYFKNMR